MRELVLNHASLRSSDSRAAVGFLKDIATGIAQLVRDGVTGHALRMAQEMAEITCAPGHSLWNAVQALQRAGARDEHVFLMRMAAKAPLLAGVPEDVKNRFLTCEARRYSLDDGAPLLYCALVDGIAVGFPAAPEWDRDRLVIEFDELQLDERFSDESENIDHLSRLAHAAPICERHRKRFRAGLTAREFWEKRRTAFPNLVFGLDVENQIGGGLPAPFHTIVGRLAELDEAAGTWGNAGGAMPSWKCKVTDESQRVRNDPTLRQARSFRSCSGDKELFMWHARFGSGGRIHLRFCRARWQVEIGYIGPHLPL